MRTKRPEPIPLTLQAALEVSDSRVSVKWSVAADDDELDWEQYYLPREELSRASRRTREALSQLQELSWECEKPTPMRDTLLELARAGSELYRVLMHGDPTMGQSAQWAAEFRAWFEQTVVSAPRGTWRIQVVHTNYGARVVPWGLVFTPRAGRELERLEPNEEDFCDFWCESFQLACRGPSSHESSQLASERRECRIAVAIEVEKGRMRKLVEDARDGRSSSGPPDQHLEDYELEDHVAPDTRAFQDLAGRYGRKDVFWYVYLRAEEDRYLLPGGGLEAYDLSYSSRSDYEERVVLAMLDGDAVVQREGGARWVDEMLQYGHSGLIAVETDITNRELRHFGWRFLREILTHGAPLIDAISAARRVLWPRSLLYGVYCDPLHVFPEPPPIESIRFIDRFLSMESEKESG